MLTTALIILAIAAPVIAAVLYFLKRKYSFTLGGTESEATPTDSDRPRYVDENVLFTVYRPKVIAPEKWYTMLAFAHLSEKRPEAQPGDPEPADEVRRIVQHFYGVRTPDQVATQQQSADSIRERQVLTFVPQVNGVEFNPEEREVKWLKDVHHADFEIRCTPESEGRTLRGTLTIYAGAVILADVPLAFQVDSVLAGASAPDKLFSDPAVEPYDKIFASYSHRDTAIVEQFKAHVEVLGHRYLQDVYSLRSGEEWSEALKKLIEEAQVFQLFWSRNSMKSEFVRQEWEHALSLRKPNFVRPVYWEDPFPAEPELLPEKLARIHFHKFQQPQRKFRKFPSQTSIKAVALAGFACIMFAAFAAVYFGPRTCVDCTGPNSNIHTPTPIPTPTPVSASEDTAIKNKTEAALAKAGFSGVIVDVKEGVVTLKGEAPRVKWRDAVRAAQESGAKRVHNQLTEK